METLLRLDHRAFFWINGFAGSYLDYFFAWPTFLGTPVLYGIVFLLMVIWDSKKVPAKITAVVLSGMGASLVSHLFKSLIKRPRPYAFFYDEIDRGKAVVNTIFDTHLSRSFPSGHAVLVFAVVTALNVLYKRKFLWLYPVAAFLGMTRVYVGAHFPSDVVGGALVGTLGGFFIARACLKSFLRERRLP